jgi:hypothetical protein
MYPHAHVCVGVRVISVNTSALTSVRIPKCETYTGSVCSAIVDYPIYVPWNFTQTDLEAKVKPQAPALLLSPLADGCRETFVQYMCAQAFNPCDSDALGRAVPAAANLFHIPFPRFPCRSICYNFTKNCPKFIAALNLTVDCTTVGTRAPTGIIDWPVTSTVLASLGGAVISTQCNSWNESQVSAFNLDEKYVCPSPLVIPDDKTADRVDAGWGDTTCAVPCPSLVYTRDEWIHGSEFFFAMGLCSFILTFWTMMTWILSPAKRKQRYILSFNVCVFFVAFATLIPFAGHNKWGPDGVGNGGWIGCRNKTELKNQSDGGWCLFQAIWLYYWAMTGIVWWNIQAWDVFFKIVMGRTKLNSQEKARKNTIYHCVAWISPLIGLIIGLSTQSMGHQNILPWCFVGGSTWAVCHLFQAQHKSSL